MQKPVPIGKGAVRYTSTSASRKTPLEYAIRLSERSLHSAMLASSVIHAIKQHPLAQPLLAVTATHQLGKPE